MGQILSFGPSSIRARRRKPRSMFYDQAVSSNPAAKLLKEALVWFNESGIEGNVTAWRNSGTGGSAYDLTTSNGVTIASYQGKVGAYFSASFTNDLLTAAGTPISEPFTWTTHAKADSFGAALNRIVSNSGGATTTYFASGTTFWGAWVGGSIRYSTEPRSTNPVVMTLTADGAGNYVLYVDAIQLSFTGTQGAWNWGKCGNSAAAVGFNGYVFDNVVWNRVLSASEVGLVVEFLK